MDVGIRGFPTKYVLLRVTLSYEVSSWSRGPQLHLHVLLHGLPSPTVVPPVIFHLYHIHVSLCPYIRQ
jgi:hypothetical protein